MNNMLTVSRAILFMTHNPIYTVVLLLFFIIPMCCSPSLRINTSSGALVWLDVADVVHGKYTGKKHCLSHNVLYKFVSFIFV